MSTEQHVAMSGAIDEYQYEYQSGADQVRENLGYVELIGAITDALLGDWDDLTLH